MHREYVYCMKLILTKYMQNNNATLKTPTNIVKLSAIILVVLLISRLGTRLPKFIVISLILLYEILCGKNAVHWQMMAKT